MYRQIITPTEKEHSVELPRELYGVRVEVIAFPVNEDMAIDEPKTDPDTFYNAIRLDFSGYKFDREEANER